MDYDTLPCFATGVILPVLTHMNCKQPMLAAPSVLHPCGQSFCHWWWTCCSKPLMPHGMQAKVTNSEPQISESALQPQHQPPAYQAESTGPSGAGETLHAQVPSPPHPSTSQQSAPNPLVCTHPQAHGMTAASSLLDFFHYTLATRAQAICDSYLLQGRRSHLLVCTCVQCILYSTFWPCASPALVAFHVACLAASLSSVQATIPRSSLLKLHILAVCFSVIVHMS